MTVANAEIITQQSCGVCQLTRWLAWIQAPSFGDHSGEREPITGD